MFNGIIKHVGKIHRIIKKNKNCYLQILSNMKFSTNEIGSSISCSGVCLTLDKIYKNKSFFYLSHETLLRSNYRKAKKGDIINLEKSMKYGDRVSGHFVQGHVDTTSLVKRLSFKGKSWFIYFSLSSKFRKLIVPKGSIAINGVSLTVSKILPNGFEVVVIPKTLKLTNLIFLKEKDLVNIEFDVFGKYINRSLKNL
tara:strand:+ start:104 stop:694 length:591 start_codon:yes stop_codon:yes gene_type:complete